MLKKLSSNLILDRIRISPLRTCRRRTHPRIFSWTLYSIDFPESFPVTDVRARFSRRRDTAAARLFSHFARNHREPPIREGSRKFFRRIKRRKKDPDEACVFRPSPVGCSLRREANRPVPRTILESGSRRDRSLRVADRAVPLPSLSLALLGSHPTLPQLPEAPHLLPDPT